MIVALLWNGQKPYRYRKKELFIQCNIHPHAFERLAKSLHFHRRVEIKGNLEFICNDSIPIIIAADSKANLIYLEELIIAESASLSEGAWVYLATLIPFVEKVTIKKQELCTKFTETLMSTCKELGYKVKTKELRIFSCCENKGDISQLTDFFRLVHEVQLNGMKLSLDCIGSIVVAVAKTAGKGAREGIKHPLRHLSIENCDVSEEGFGCELMRVARFIEQIELIENNISHENLKAMARCLLDWRSCDETEVSLRKLTLRCKSLGGNGLAADIINLGSLVKHFDLSENESFDANDIHGMRTTLSQLIAYRVKMKEYKKLCKQKRNFFWDTQITKLQENFNKQNFWNVWKEFDERITEESIAIKDGKKWELHYRSLFLAPPSSANKFDNDNIQNSTFHTQLNEPITNSEIMKSVNQLKTNKSAGIDRISNEMIKHATPDVIATIKNIFNIFLDKAAIPQSWCQGLITPIYKKGNKMDPGNYRGICVANAMLKLLCIILNNRLTNYSVDKNIIHPNQIGFQRNCRTTDHIFTLKTLINKHVQDKSKQKVHAAFIDFAKAFDTVWHHGLFFKLRNKGINGNFLQLIQSIYNSTECAVKIGSKHTKFFKCSRGVRQGCPLSPTLFNIYINDLIDNLEKINPTPLTLQDKKISCLMYADDIIILSSSHKGLQDCLDTLASFCNNWKLSINKSKSKCMTFYKRKCKYNRNFFIDDTPLENVTEYTYLGLTVDAKCSFKETLEMLSCKAHRAIYALNSRYQLKHLPIQAALKLFDSTIVPILLYGSEVWSIYENVDDKEWDSNRIEKIHTQFLKRILGVNRSTTNIMVRGELGRYPLRIQTDSRTINFAKHISEECKPSALVHYSMEYEKSITNRKTIISYINDLSDKLTKNEVSKKLITEHSKSNIKKILEANYQLSWKSRIKNCSKALTYGSYKNRINLEAYLSLITNRADRRIMSKLRLSDHCLTIERGRHCKPPIERDKRFCLSCKDKIEDETHFILECDMFKEERVTFLHYTKDIYPNFETIPTLEQKLIFLQTNENCHFLETFTRYLNTTYKLRSQNETQKIDDA